MLCSRLSALQAAYPFLADRLSLGFADGVLSFANGNVEYLLGKLDGIARTLRHERSIAQAAPVLLPYEISN